MTIEQYKLKVKYFIRWTRYFYIASGAMFLLGLVLYWFDMSSCVMCFAAAMTNLWKATKNTYKHPKIKIHG